MKCILCLISSLLVLRRGESYSQDEATQIQDSDVVGFDTDLADFENLALAALTSMATRSNDEAAIVTEAKFVSSLITTLDNNRKNLKKVSGSSRRRISRICKFAMKLLENTINILKYVYKKARGIHMNILAMAAYTTTEVKNYVSDTLFCFVDNKITRTDFGNSTKANMIYEHADQLLKSTNENMQVKLNELTESEVEITEDIYFLLDSATYIKDTMEKLTHSLQKHVDFRY